MNTSTPGENETIFHGNILPLTIRLGAPILISYLFLTLYFMIDTYFISRIDPSSTALLSGTALVFPVITLYSAAGMGICTGMASLISRGIGEKNKTMIETASGSGIFIVVVFCLATLVPGYFFSQGILKILAGSALSDEALSHGRDYFLFLLPGLSVILLLHVAFGIFQGEGRMTHIGVASVLAGVLNIILDPLLIFGCHMGVSGAALATGISYGVSLLYAVIVFSTGRFTVPLRLGPETVNRATVLEIIRVGVPESLSMVSLALVFIVMNNLVSSIGESVMNAWSICSRLDTFVVIPAYAIAAATLTLVGQNFGRKNMRRVSHIYHLNMAAGVVAVLGFALVYMALAPLLFPWFSALDEVVVAAVRQVRLISFSFVGVSGVAVSAALFQGTGRPVPALSIRLIRIVVLIFLPAFVLARYFGLGMTGIFAGIIFGNTLILFVAWAWTGAYIRKLIDEHCAIFSP